MATLTAGTAATLKSLTVEGAFYEALSRIRLLELDSTKNTQNLNNVTLSIDQTASRLTGSFNFPATKSLAADGSVNWLISPYLTNTGFTPGSPVGTIKSASISAAIVELAELIQARESDTSKNPQSIQGITELNYDSEASRVSGSFDIALDIALAATGETQVKAKTYLLD